MELDRDDVRERRGGRDGMKEAMRCFCLSHEEHVCDIDQDATHCGCNMTTFSAL